jgi:RNA polymerase sigma-70 factor (ECF subfamily)
LDSGEIELERIWDKEWRKQLIDMALERVKQLVGHRQYQIFYCYVIQEQKAEEVAKFLGVSRDQVYVAKNRVGKVYEGELKILGKEML